MKRALLTTMTLLLGLPAAVWAEDPCPFCVIGVYDDSSGTRPNAGFWEAGGTNPFKEIFIAIDYDPSSGLDGLTGIELSISGLPAGPLPPADEWFPTPASVTGVDIQTPADTTGIAAGGKTITWDQCLTGNRILGKITLISVAPVGTNRVIRVLHRFPPTNPSFPFPIIRQCDAPSYTPTSVAGGCYVLNPTCSSGIVEGCSIQGFCQAVKSKTWSGIKNLYR